MKKQNTPDPSNFLNNLSQGLSGLKIGGGPDTIFYDIQEEDKNLWSELIRIGDAESIQNILKANKAYLLTHIIGNPDDPINQLLRNNEARFGNTPLFSRLASSHDESIVKVPHKEGKREELLKGNNSGTDYFLRYLELKQKNAANPDTEKSLAEKKRLEIKNFICFKDREGKTPLLFACKTANQAYALRLINLDEEGITLTQSDKINQHTPLHIACILGLKDVVKKLLERKVDTSVRDCQGYTPFDYLRCPEEHKKVYIQQVLESVNFFFGRFFEESDKAAVIEQLLNLNSQLGQELTQEGLLNDHSRLTLKK